MAIQDVRMELIQHEYTGIRSALHTLMDRMDGYEAAVLGLTEAVSQNGERITALEQRMESVEGRLDSIESKLDRLMAHLDVPPKPPAGFVKE